MVTQVSEEGLREALQEARQRGCVSLPKARGQAEPLHSSEITSGEKVSLKPMERPTLEQEGTAQEGHDSGTPALEWFVAGRITARGRPPH